MKIKKFEFNMFPVNCYVLSDETKEAVIIDAGCFYEEEKQALKRYIDSNSLTVKHLLNTHLHLDHIFGNPFLLQEYGLKAEANQADEFWLEPSSCTSTDVRFPIARTTRATRKICLRRRCHHLRQYTKLEAIHVPGSFAAAASFITAKKTTASSAATCCSREASAVQTSPEETSTNFVNIYAVVCLYCPPILQFIPVMETRPLLESRRKTILSSDKEQIQSCCSGNYSEYRKTDSE